MRMDRWVATGVLLVLLGWGGVSGAAEQDDVVMGEVVVTASRQAEETVKVPANVTVVTAEDIKNSTAQNVAEVLGSLEGFHVSDITGNKRSYTVDLRGFGESAPSNLLVLVDGRRINQADLGGTDWNLIPLERINRIEILRGGRGSVLYGDNAAAGVINIITKEGGGKPEGNISVQYGSYATFKSAASMDAAGELWSVGISANYLDSDGYRDNSESEAKDVGLNLRLDPSETIRFHLSGGYHEDRTGLPGSLLQSELDAGAERTDTNQPDDYSDIEDSYIKAGFGMDILSGDSFELETSFRHRKSVWVATFSSITYESETDIDTYILSPKLIFRESFGTVKNQIVLGYDYINSKEDIADNWDLERENNAFYVYDELQVNDDVSLSGGYRIDRAVYKFNPSDPDKATIDEEVYNAGINYSYASGSHVYAGFAKSYRYPLLDELYNFTDTDSINTDIKVQTSDQYEVGVSHLLTKNVTVAANFFQSITEDEIFFNLITYSNVNLDGRTKRQGAEIMADYRSGGFHAKVDFTYIDATIDGGQYDGKSVPDVANHQASTNIGYKLSSGPAIDLNGVYVGKRPLISDFDNAFDEQEDFFVLNAKIQYQWRRFNFFVDFNNLLNESYSSYGGVSSFFDMTTFETVYEPGYYPSPEFNFLAGVSVRFGAL
jgi:iron complex outermembrane receptor protein